MPEEPSRENDARWLQPPEPGEVHIRIAVGEGAKLTRDVREALDSLARAIEEEEVQGFAKPKPPPKCPKEASCDLCNDLSGCKPRVVIPNCRAWTIVID